MRVNLFASRLNGRNHFLGIDFAECPGKLPKLGTCHPLV
jgi:hypothetical protein